MQTDHLEKIQRVTRIHKLFEFYYAALRGRQEHQRWWGKAPESSMALALSRPPDADLEVPTARSPTAPTTSLPGQEPSKIVPSRGAPFCHGQDTHPSALWGRRPSAVHQEKIMPPQKPGTAGRTRSHRRSRAPSTPRPNPKREKHRPFPKGPPVSQTQGRAPEPAPAPSTPRPLRKRSDEWGPHGRLIPSCPVRLSA